MRLAPSASASACSHRLTFDRNGDEGVNVVVRILQSNLIYGDGHVGTARPHSTTMH